MTSRCVEIMNLADNTYNQYKCYGNVIEDAVTRSLEAQRDFTKIDLLLNGDEKDDMYTYITSYIISILLDQIKTIEKESTE
mgnify:CR=1 FL=1|nr:MAG TPA: hypothetical protein [Bacteriophage sp.]